MPEPLRIAVAGLGRMGIIHALHVHELDLAGSCQLVAFADPDKDRALRIRSDLGRQTPVFNSVDELARAKVCDAVVVVTPTDRHREHASVLIEHGHRVLLEKPLTGTLEADRQFSAELDRNYPNALMLAFQRRFDAPQEVAKRMIEAGTLGRVFKIYSALEDSNPAPNGYRSGGILPDMSIHNVDEVLWLTGDAPKASLAIGSRIYSHSKTTAEEDFDDALLYVWFESGAIAQVQVSRNHVSGYRVETIVFGEEGQIRIGRFEQKPFTVILEAYGRRGSPEPLARQEFEMREYGRELPEFADRFGAAYKDEIAAFIECCSTKQPFPITHRDGLRAQEVISAAMRSVVSSDAASPI